MFDLGYFVYMDSFDNEKEDNKSRSPEQENFERENIPQYIKNDDEKNKRP